MCALICTCEQLLTNHNPELCSAVVWCSCKTSVLDICFLLKSWYELTHMLNCWTPAAAGWPATRLTLHPHSVNRPELQSAMREMIMYAVESCVPSTWSLSWLEQVGKSSRLGLSGSGNRKCVSWTGVLYDLDPNVKFRQCCHRSLWALLWSIAPPPPWPHPWLIFNFFIITLASPCFFLSVSFLKNCIFQNKSHPIHDIVQYFVHFVATFKSEVHL